MKMAVLLMGIVAMFLELAAATTDHTVGSPGGSWDLQTNFRTWAESNKFIAGDRLIFQYPAMHNVFEVSKKDYDSCSTSSPMMTDSSGNTIVSLKTAGKRYFICGIPGHCDIGMKMEVDINPVNQPSSPRAFPSPPPPSSSTPFKQPPPFTSTPFKQPPPFTSSPFKPPPFPSTPFKPPPSFLPKTPSSKVSASPPSSSTPFKSPSPAMAPMSSPYKGPATPVGSPSLPTTSASENHQVHPLLGVSIAIVLIATYGF